MSWMWAGEIKHNQVLYPLLVLQWCMASVVKLLQLCGLRTTCVVLSSCVAQERELYESKH